MISFVAAGLTCSFESYSQIPLKLLATGSNSKKSWKHPLGVKINAPVTEVISAWKLIHQTFETSLANIKERNPHIWDQREHRRSAEAHLKMFNLNTQ